MAIKKRGLGRGLDALLGSAALSTMDGEQRPDSELKEIPVDLMQRGKYQPRINMHNESLQELADSIGAQGVVQPIVVRPIGGGKYEIIAGERRWRAAQLAGLHTIPSVVRDVPDSAAIAIALIENIQRENLSPLEEAYALQRLLDEFDMTHQQAAEAVGRSRAAVSNLLRLQELNKDVQAMLQQGELEMGHGRALLGLRGGTQTAAATRVVKRGLSVRETEQLVRRENEQLKRPKSATVTHLDPDIRRFQDQLAEKLGAKVQIQHTAKGKGKLSIQYNSLDELEGILNHIK